MPALNIIAIHETVRNSGRSLSRPRGIRPYLLIATPMAKSTKPLAARTKAQPPYGMTTSLRSVSATTARLPGEAIPHATIANAMIADTPNTTWSVRGRCFSCAGVNSGSCFASAVDRESVSPGWSTILSESESSSSVLERSPFFIRMTSHMQLPPRRRSSAGDCPIGAPLNPVVTSMHRWGSEPIGGS